MRRSRKFCQRGPTLICFSWWGEGGSKYHYKRTIIGPPVKRHLNGVSLACRWWPNIEFWLGSFVIFRGIGTSIAKKPYICAIFMWGYQPPAPPPPPPPPLLDARMSPLCKTRAVKQILKRNLLQQRDEEIKAKWVSKSVDPDEITHMSHLIWIYTVCQLSY